MTWAEQVTRQLRPVCERIAAELAEGFRDEVVQVMREGAPSGFTDDEGYRSSAPGQAPAYGKGVYASSWKSTGAQSEGLQSGATAYSALRGADGKLVAEKLEWGDEDVAARPHVRVALDQYRAKAEAFIDGINR